MKILDIKTSFVLRHLQFVDDLKFRGLSLEKMPISKTRIEPPLEFAKVISKRNPSLKEAHGLLFKTVNNEVLVFL